MTTSGGVSSVPSAAAYTIVKTYVPIHSTSKTEREENKLPQAETLQNDTFLYIYFNCAQHTKVKDKNK